MRIEIGGAQITTAVAEVLDTLQNQPEVTKAYLEAIDAVTRTVILDINGEDDAEAFNRLRALQMIRRDLSALAAPPDVDDPANDNPAVSL